ncbi:hypothetical protein [Kineosporia sp. NBRC 101731]|uniref:hypothetical protein n=1 Tax=Kineosporia sp. NBRC 101731 TaxID=3032199 RepID=UPI0024A4A2C6|nr:hypothetical protein [Kineosporia sp. NBRC 101731]GLY32012.1 hypothetical protein Kisp02_53770 [Kineosporia sp. NBRC 101731]
MTKLMPYEISDDGRTLLIRMPNGDGILTTTFRRDEGMPWTEQDIVEAMASVMAKVNMAPGQENTHRRIKVGPYAIYASLMTGPPTWWVPQVSVKREFMVGWLRAALAIAVRREDAL